MNFDLSEEQVLLGETVRRLVDTEYGLAKRKVYAATPEGFSRAMWRRYAELGLLGLPFAEAYGGSGGSAVDLMIVIEALGRGLVLEPYVETVVLAGSLLALAASDSQKREMLPEIAAGRLMLALAHGEERSRYRLEHVETRAQRAGDGYRLDGRKGVVLAGESADMFIISARNAGEPRDADGISLFLVDRSAPGLSLRGYPTMDGRRGAELALDAVEIRRDALLGPLGRALPAIEHAVDCTLAALVAEAVGIMDTLNRMTLDYAKTRKQFGVPIGSFQVLQHRLVDMAIEQEQAKSMALLAALSVDSGKMEERRRAVSAAKAVIGRAGRFIGEQAIQLHGGIGMTEEYAVGHYFKRLAAIDRSFGDLDHHLERFARAAKEFS